ncbi:MAG: hypothetical protein HY657_15090 [Acidobacteria bacterium]|nr:hypothetical protein [Acidobacteriota bacterium]
MDWFLMTVTIVSLTAAAGFGAAAWRSLDQQRRRSAARVAALAAAIDGEEHSTPVAVSSLFGTTPGAAVRGRPLITATVVAALAVALIVVVAMAGRTPGAQTAAVQETSPLELMSMHHTRDGSSLTVTGLVRNPRAGPTVSGIAAVVFAFDRDGTFVMSAKAPLDFTTLAPGDESPFVVSLPNVGDVGRYRVSFRTESGVIRHVDRRSAQSARS